MANEDILKIAKRLIKGAGFTVKECRVKVLGFRDTDFQKVIAEADGIEYGFDVEDGKIVPESVRMS